MSAPAAAAATTYYVDNSVAGNSDSNACTSHATPCASILGGYNKVTAGNGDTVVVYPGNGYAGNFTLSGHGGAVGSGCTWPATTGCNYTTINGVTTTGAPAFPGNRATMPTVTMVNGDNFGIQINDPYVVINGINQQGLNGNTATYASGIVIGSSFTSSATNHLLIHNSIAENNPGCGIQTQGGDYFDIEGNIVDGNANYSIYGCSGVGIGEPQPADSVMAPTYKIIIAYNFIYNNVEKVIETACGGICDGEGLIFDTLSGGFSGGSAYAGSIWVHDNAFYLNGSNAIEFFKPGATTTLLADYNTAYQNGQSGVNQAEFVVTNSTSGSTVVLANNILQPQSGYAAISLVSASNVTCNYNDRYGSTGDGCTGANDVTTNPLFVSPTSNFSIPANSPAKGLASGAYNTSSLDIIGHFRPSNGGYDAGAYQVPPVGPASPNNTIIQASSHTAITDSNTNSWTITSGAQSALNGSTISYTANVIEMAYVNSVVWQKNNSNNWYSFTSLGAVASGPTTTSPIAGCP